MTCERADELLGAYAVDALSEQEAAEFAAHLRTCARHAELAAEMRSVGARMPALADPMPPPPALRARILDAVRAEPQDAARDVAPVAIERREQRRARVTWNPFDRGGRFAWGAVAAGVVIVIGGLLAWNVALLTNDDGGATEFAAAITSFAPLHTADGERAGVVAYFEDEHEAVVFAEGLEQLDPAQNTYQAWSVIGDEAVSLGLMTVDANGRASMAIPYNAERADAFAITIEPPNGSPQPTSDPVYLAEL